MNTTLNKRLERLEATNRPAESKALIVPLPECVPPGYSGKVIVTGVPRPGDAL